MFVSYAQNFEDVVLWRALRHVQKGFYIDIGAQDPVIDSVSLAFYELGWRGVHVEPTAAYASALREARPDETVLECAIGEGGQLISLHEIPETGLSTGDTDIAESHARIGFASRETDVPSVSLAALFARYGGRDIHWLKIDVEGMEASVLRSWGDSVARPWIVVVEATVPLGQQMTYDAWEHSLVERGYRFVYWDGLNRFYLAEQHAELVDAFSAPPNVFDAFTLAGTGSHHFTARLKKVIASLKKQLKDLEAQRAEVDSTLVQALRERDASEARRISEAQALSVHIDELGGLLSASKDRGLELDAELARAQETHAAAREALQSQADALQDRTLTLQGQLRDVVKREAQLDSHLASVKHELEEARKRFDEASARTEERWLTVLQARDATLPTYLAEQQEASRLLHQQGTERVLDVIERIAHANQEQSQRNEERLALQRDETRRLQLLLERERDESAALRASWWPRLFRPAVRAARADLEMADGRRLARPVPPLSTSEEAVFLPLLPAKPVPRPAPLQGDQTMPSRSIASVDDLLDLHDESFVRSAYLSLLGRAADPDGFAYYVARVRSGISKRQIIGEMATSPEAARRRPHSLAGLDELVGTLPKRPPGLLYRMTRRMLSGAVEPLEINLRRLENSLHRTFDRQSSDLARMEASLSAMSERLTQQEQRLREWARAQRSLPATPQPSRPPEATPRQIYYYVDHTVGCAVNTGMQRVVRRLAQSLVRMGISVVFVKWNATTRGFTRIDRRDLEHLSRWNGPALSASAALAYPDADGPRDTIPPGRPGDWLLVPEVTHITDQPQPMTLDVIAAGHEAGLKVAFVFYDATPLRRPELVGMSVAHADYMSTLLLADVVVPISRWASADLISFLKLHQHAKLAPSPWIEPLSLPGESQAGARETRRGQASAPDNLILSVGSIVPHKNQLMLVEAFDRYCGANPQTAWELFLVGNLALDLSPRLHEFSSANARIRYLGDVSDPELEGLYRRASFTVFPSVMEGFGLPILESLWYGAPCVCANFGAMDEVAKGGGCLTVDTRDVAALERAIALLIDDPKLLEGLRNEASTRPIKTWVEYTDELVRTLDAATDPRARMGPIYFWIDHTSRYAANSGIQRVVRGLGRALLEIGVSLIPAKWSEDAHRLISACPADLEHLAKWNGPAVAHWSPWLEPADTGLNGWLLIGELSHYLAKTTVDDIHEFASASGLRCAWIFHDALPFTMRDIYPPEATEAHRKYMLALRNADKVLANSFTSRSDLIAFLNTVPERTRWIERRIAAIPLPGEFLETPRALAPKPVPSGRVVRILCVGTVEPRKNHLRLLDAFAEARRAGVSAELTIAGGDAFQDLAEQVQRRVDALPGVRWIRKPSDAVLRSLYEECDFTVYPSLAEGFGLPILESLWFGRPCLCAAFGSMAEVAEGGGCLTVDVTSVTALADGITDLVGEPALRRTLANEACARKFKTWREYAAEVIGSLAEESAVDVEPAMQASFDSEAVLDLEMPNLSRPPLLSICVSTYNRARWLELNLRNIFSIFPEADRDIEILVCDNASTDDTEAVASRHHERANYRYVRNARNVGMLGNLRVTANAARGRYVWILGDDDLIKPDAVATILAAIRDNPDASLLYLNYSYTREDDPTRILDLRTFFDESTPIVPATRDIAGTVREICTQSENFFTAIYCLVFRRDHAIRAYSQDTTGRPFSTLLTCIPTTYYVLTHMMDEAAVWIGRPLLVVNMNVSWMKYAPLWILERIPEVYDLAERQGADQEAVDRWRIHNLPGLLHFFNEIFASDPEHNAAYVSVSRIINRFKHLSQFKELVPKLRITYGAAHDAGHRLAKEPTNRMFAAFDK